MDGTTETSVPSPSPKLPDCDPITHKTPGGMFECEVICDPITRKTPDGMFECEVEAAPTDATVATSAAPAPAPAPVTTVAVAPLPSSLPATGQSADLAIVGTVVLVLGVIAQRFARRNFSR